MKWKHLVETQSRKTYVLPEGWDSRETIAAELECSPEKVRIHLGPAVRSRAIEVQSFPVWDDVTKKVTRVTAYRNRMVKPPKK